MRKHRWGRWLFFGALAGLYLYGRRLRPAKRLRSVEAIDDPACSVLWGRVSNWPQFRALRAMLVRRMVLGQQRLRVLDVGCGAGQLALELAQRPQVHEAVGIDLSDDLITLARATAEEQGVNARFLQADGAEMPFADASFDLVVSTLSLHHWSQPVEVLREIHRVLAPGGRVMIVDLRRDAFPPVLGGLALLSRLLAPPLLRALDEPVSSFQSAYTPCEAVLLAAKAGWTTPTVISGPIWLLLETTVNGEE